MKALLKKDKKGWIKIIESFISVMIVMSVFVVMLARQPEFSTQEEELTRIQKHILDQVVNDIGLRNNVLEGNTENIEKIVGDFIPEGFSYIVKTCPLGDICSANIPVTNEIFVEEIIVAANLTEYQPTILKLFFWQTSCGNNYCETNFGENEQNCEEDCSGVAICNLGEARCVNSGTIEECKGSPANWVSRSCTPEFSTTSYVCSNGACVEETPTCGDGTCNGDETGTSCPSDCGGKLVANYSNLRINDGSSPSCAENENWYYIDTKLEEKNGLEGITIQTRQKCISWVEGGITKHKCDDIKTEPSMFSNPYISAGGFIERKDNYFCLLQGYYPHTMNETFWGIDDEGNNLEDSYTFIVNSI